MAICWKLRVSGATGWFNLNQKVTMRPVRTISRKDLGEETPVRPTIGVDLLGILRDHTPDPCRNQWEDMVRSVWRHAEAGRNDRPRLTSTVYLGRGMKVGE